MRTENKRGEEWGELLCDIATIYNEGEVIPHEWLKGRLRITQPRYDDFGDQQLFVEALTETQFLYMQQIEALKDDLLDMDICIRSVRGEGYAIVPSTDQVRYGYDKAVNDIAKALREGSAIMTHVAHVGAEQQAHDNDLRAKMAHLKQLFKENKR